MNKLNGKTALVTGASRGIGRASALALAQAGAQVLAHDGRLGRKPRRSSLEIRELGGKAEKVGVDLAETDGPHALARPSARSSATVWTSSSRTPASPSPRRSKTRPSTTSTPCSPSTSARRSSSCSNSFRPSTGRQRGLPLLARRRAPRSAPCPPTRRRKARWTRWSSISPPRSVRAASASTPSPRAWSTPTCPTSPRPKQAGLTLRMQALQRIAAAGRHRRRRRVPGLGRRALDHRRHPPRRRRLEALSRHPERRIDHG